MTPAQIYDVALNLLAPRLAQIRGIGSVNIGGSSPLAVRVELNPQALYKYGIGLEDIRAALAAANANSPKGTIDAAPALSNLHKRSGNGGCRLRAAGHRLP